MRYTALALGIGAVGGFDDRAARPPLEVLRFRSHKNASTSIKDAGTGAQSGGTGILEVQGRQPLDGGHPLLEQLGPEKFRCPREK